MDESIRMSAPLTHVSLFGSTGQTGRVVLRHLLRSKESLHLRLYVRSRAKLLSLFPSISSHAHVEIFEGSITDVALVEDCCRGVQKIICTLGENENTPTVTILEDAADAIIAALSNLKASDSGWTRPRMIMLSSSTWNPTFAAARPALVHWMIKTAFSFPYADLRRAQKKLLANPELVSLLLVQPPLLVQDESSGYEISEKAVKLACSYEDLGASFVELLLNHQYDSLSAIGVSSRLGDRPLRYAPIIFRLVFLGFLGHLRHFWSPVHKPKKATV